MKSNYRLGGGGGGGTHNFFKMTDHFLKKKNFFLGGGAYLCKLLGGTAPRAPPPLFLRACSQMKSCDHYGGAFFCPKAHLNPCHREGMFN